MTNLEQEKIIYLSWDKNKLEQEKLLLYEKLTLINTILTEKKENKNEKNGN